AARLAFLLVAKDQGDGLGDRIAVLRLIAQPDVHADTPIVLDSDPRRRLQPHLESHTTSSVSDHLGPLYLPTIGRDLARLRHIESNQPSRSFRHAREDPELGAFPHLLCREIRLRLRLYIYHPINLRAAWDGLVARRAFLQTLRSVIDVHGQRVSATDRLYLLESMPTMIVWGERENTIPLQHGREAHEAIPHSHFETLSNAAHFPHLEDPDALSDVLREFLQATAPGRIEDADWGAVLSRHS